MKTFRLLDRIEIEVLDQLIEDVSDLDSKTLNENLKQHRKDIIKEHNNQVETLKLIEADNPEMYRIIYWHFVKGKTWRETNRKLYPDLMSFDGCYVKRMYQRYMAKHFPDIN